MTWLCGCNDTRVSINKLNTDKTKQSVTNMRGISLVYVLPLRRRNTSFFRLSREIECNGCGSVTASHLLSCWKILWSNVKNSRHEGRQTVNICRTPYALVDKQLEVFVGNFISFTRFSLTSRDNYLGYKGRCSCCHNTTSENVNYVKHENILTY